MSSPTKVYWRSKALPPASHAILIIAAIAALLTAEGVRQRENREHYSDMVAASRTVSEGLTEIRRERLLFEPINPDLDPLESGVIGISSSPVTSVAGHLPSKQASINPNWGAVAVDLLLDAGVQEGDPVAVAVSGSFPALNLAVYAALEQLGARPIVIASGSASQYGANIPDLLWIDMERILADAGVISTRAVACSLGAQQDRGIGLSDEGIAEIKESIAKSEATLLEVQSTQESVSKRIAIYTDNAGEEPIRALVNVGGGTATTGPSAIDQYFGSGLIRSAPPRAFAIDSVMGHYLQQDVPVINFSGISVLAERHGLPHPPVRSVAIGEGGVYEATTYLRWLAALLFVALLGLVWFLTRIPNVTSIFRRTSKSKDADEPQV